MKLLEACWGNRKGWVSLPINHNGKWYERWFEWPQDRTDIEKWITDANKRACVYFSPLVYGHPSRRTAKGSASRWAWADFDEVDADTLDPKPTILWETSPGKYQGLYLLNAALSGEELEVLNRRIAVATRADASGWDAGQVLRIPGTRNFKYDDAPKGRFIYVNGPRYTTKDFEHIEIPAEADVGDLNELSFEETLDEWREVLPSRALQLLETDPENVKQGERSDKLWQLTLLLTECGLNKSIVYTLIKGSPWNKFRGRSDEEERLKKEIAKAVQKIAVSIVEPEQEEPDDEPVIPENENELALPKHSWLRQYVTASRIYVPGVPYIYHLACGLSLLSVIVNRNVTISNVDAKLHPVLWTLLVAPSNSGKSRTYDFMMDVFEATGLYQAIPPINSFSPEGIIEAINDSPRKSAWLVPDEAGGLFKTIRTRDYLAGTRELLNQMADGRIISRKTKKSEIMLQNYSLGFYGTTQPEGFLTSLGRDDMTTGFLRRFFILYRDTYQDVTWRMIPPGREEAIKQLSKGLLDLQYHITQGHPPIDLVHNGTRIGILQPERTELTLSAGAFRRFVSVDAETRKAARDMPELAPFLSGSSSHLLKVAALVTLSNYPELWAGGVTIDEETMNEAAKLLENETTNTSRLLSLIGSNETERAISAIVDYLATRPGRKATRTEVQRRHGKLIGTKWDLDRIEETMVDRGIITVTLEKVSPKATRKAKVYFLNRIRR